MLRRVVVTGQGIVSSLGNNIAEGGREPPRRALGHPLQPDVPSAACAARSVAAPASTLKPASTAAPRIMGDAAAYTYLAMQQAIEQSGLQPHEVSNPRTGLVAGSGGASSMNQVWAADTLRAKGVKRVGPMMVTRCMASTVSACLASPLPSRVSTARSPRPAPPARTASATPRS